MSSIEARYGKYAIRSSHEMLAGETESRRFIERVGFKLLLSNGGVTVDNSKY